LRPYSNSGQAKNESKQRSRTLIPIRGLERGHHRNPLLILRRKEYNTVLDLLAFVCRSHRLDISMTSAQ